MKFKTYSLGFNQVKILHIVDCASAPITATHVYRVIKRERSIRYFSVWRSMKKLKEDGLITENDNHKFCLTPLGKVQLEQERLKPYKLRAKPHV